MNRFTAKIGMDNKPSLKMFEGIGFTEVCIGRFKM
jgi:L-amino acid N-acyltransferase YncA